MSLDTFAQQDFRRLSALAFKGSDSHTARFDVDGLPLVVDAHAPGILRLRLGHSSLPDYGLLTITEPCGSLQVEPESEGWRVASGDLALHLTGNPLRLTLIHKGRTVLSSITDQHFRGRV